MQRHYQTVENRDVVTERSIVETDFYARRFKEFLFERVFHPDDQSAPPIDTSHRYSMSSLYPPLSSAWRTSSFFADHIDRRVYWREIQEDRRRKIWKRGIYKESTTRRSMTDETSCTHRERRRKHWFWDTEGNTALFLENCTTTRTTTGLLSLNNGSFWSWKERKPTVPVCSQRERENDAKTYQLNQWSNCTRKNLEARLKIPVGQREECRAALGFDMRASVVLKGRWRRSNQRSFAGHFRERFAKHGEVRPIIGHEWPTLIDDVLRRDRRDFTQRKQGHLLWRTCWCAHCSTVVSANCPLAKWCTPVVVSHREILGISVRTKQC